MKLILVLFCLWAPLVYSENIEDSESIDIEVALKEFEQEFQKSKLAPNFNPDKIFYIYSITGSQLLADQYSTLAEKYYLKALKEPFHVDQNRDLIYQQLMYISFKDSNKPNMKKYIEQYKKFSANHPMKASTATVNKMRNYQKWIISQVN